MHFASLLSGSTEQNRPLGWQVNMNGSFALFEAAIAHGVEQVFFASSVASYGGDLPSPMPEDQPQWPNSLYGVTKMAVEHLGVYYHRRHGLDFRCIRLPVVVSAYAPTGAVSAYTSRVFVEAVQQGEFTLKVNPTTRPSSVYVKDVLWAMLALLDAPADRLTRRVYNIHAIAPTAQAVADAIMARVPGARIVFDTDPHVAALIESWPVEIEDASARRDWHWQPRYTLDALADDFIAELQHASEHASEL